MDRDDRYCADSPSGEHEQASDEQCDDLGAPESNLCAFCLEYDVCDPYADDHAAGMHDREAMPGCWTCDDLMADDAGECVATWPLTGHPCEHVAGHPGHHDAIIVSEWVRWCDDPSTCDDMACDMRAEG